MYNVQWHFDKKVEKIQECFVVWHRHGFTLMTTIQSIKTTKVLLLIQRIKSMLMAVFPSTKADSRGADAVFIQIDL